MFCRNRYNVPLTSVFTKYRFITLNQLAELSYGSLLVFILSYDTIRVKDSFQKFVFLHVKLYLRNSSELIRYRIMLKKDNISLSKEMTKSFEIHGKYVIY